MENNYDPTDDGVDGTDGAALICSLVDLSAITGYIFIFITIISTIENILLIVVLISYKRQKFIPKMFFLNLACSDLIFTATLPFWATYHLHHWVFGDFLCKFVAAFYFIGLYSSIMIVTAMTVDRFFTVVLNKFLNDDLRKRRCAVGACVAAWVIGIAASVYDANKIGVEDDVYCEESSSDGYGYSIQLSLLFLLPLIIIIVCHSAIIKTVLQATIRQRHRVVSVVFCIVAANFICWGPYNVVLFIYSLSKPSSCEAEERLAIAYSICRFLGVSHCCLNPLLCLLSENLRKHVLTLLCGKKIGLNRRERSPEQNNLSGVQTVRMSTSPNPLVMVETRAETIPQVPQIIRVQKILESNSLPRSFV
ncbi:chemokine XC receptor 1 [Nothobranchius furzeri]|nr:chemokine XC receptor 1 [Nothobranchius furzeri]KAF7222275.1 chemokine XC receptor 1-like [Nothobranchius furzeri]